MCKIIIMDRIYKIAKSIQHYLTGCATDDEVQEVEVWKNERNCHQELLNEFQADADLQKRIQEYGIFDKDEAFRRFLNSKRRIVRRGIIYRVASIAAVVLVVLGVILYQEREQEPLHVAAVAPVVIHHGSSKAVLVLDNGDEIILKDSMFLEMTDNTARISVRGNQIQYTEDSVSDESKKQVRVNSILTPKGGEYQLTLSDGTRVWLNADSRLDFPVVFAGKEREVYVRGEVYFEVAKNANHPFLVKTDKMEVKVLGTSFNVSAYEDERVSSATLVEGSIELVLQDGERSAVRLLPGEQAIVEDGNVSVRQVDAELYAAWTKDCFAFESESLEAVLRKLSRWYNVDFRIENNEMQEKYFSGIIPKYEEVSKVLKMIEMTTNITFEIKSNTIIIR